jgi:UDP-N-acetylglucosamine 3-dehydrogenase
MGHKVGVIGVGNMGRNHLRVLDRLPGVSQIVAFDVRPGFEAGLPPSSKLSAARSLDELLTRTDSVVIASQTATHADVVRAALGAGRHVLCEKPIAHNVAEGNALCGLFEGLQAKNPRLVFGVGHIERFNPAVLSALRGVRSGIIGEPVSGSFRRIGGYPRGELRDNNVVIDLAVHDVDLASLFVFPGDSPRVVGARSQRVKRPENADVADILLASEKSRRAATVHVNWLTPFRSRAFWVVGTEGFLEVDLIEQKVTVKKSDLLLSFHTSGRDATFESIAALSRACDVIQLGVQNEEPLKLELEAFLRAVEGVEPFPVSAREGAQVLSLVIEALA